MPLSKYENHRRWVKRNPDKRRIQKRRYYLKYADRIREKERNKYDPMASKEYYKKHPEKARERSLKWRHGITLGDYEELADRQYRRCAICEIDEGLCRRQVLHVDHNHTTGKIRGLLCENCNKMLGHGKDRVEIFLAAIAYLKATGGG